MSGRRDFNELNAKLEKHFQRLPDYAQRAQQKLQKYSQNGRSDGEQHTEQHPRPVPAELPVVSEIRDKWVRWNHPAAKLERRKRRTSRALTLWIVLTLLSVLWAVVGYAGVTGVQEGLPGAFTGIAATLVFATLGVRSGMRLYQLNRTTPPRTARPPSLPPPGSAAREPMERLAKSEASLTDLLTQLTAPSHGVPAPVSELSVEDARTTAAEAAAALRGLAARVESIERARESAPPGEREALDSAVATLRTQLDDGLDGFGALVAAAGKAVAASSAGVQPAKQALTDATDRLAGLASALRDLS